MTERGRNRLVGAVILLSLAVILLPMLFDGAGIERRSVAEWPPGALELESRDDDFDTAADPAAWAFVDEVETRRRAEQIRGRPEHEPLPASEAADAEATALPDEAADAVSPGLDGGGLPRAFSVQLAAFRDQDNARALRQRLLDDGYDAYMIEEGGAGETLHRVAVGPRIDRDAALRLQAELAERYQLEGLVVRFVIGGRSGGRDG
ncbi:MAG: SPOR domain-containing protein [Gammaproteobacteria bacterium]|nr:SPOR domain-containing protein [Gammaproteobacteria bacterium]